MPVLSTLLQLWGLLHILLGSKRETTDVGARGVVLGRNIYIAESPAKIVEALKAFVCNGITTADAVKIMKK